MPRPPKPKSQRPRKKLTPEQQHALTILRAGPNPELFAYVTSGPRLSILAELGRLDSKDLVEWAEVICEDRLSTAEAIRRVSAWRNGREVFPAADKAELIEHLVEALERYWGTHGNPDDFGILEMTCAALDALKVVYQDKIAKGD